MGTIGVTTPPAPAVRLSGIDVVFVSLNVVLVVVSTFAVIVRFWSRKLSRSVGWDDGLSLGALVLAYGNFIACLLIATLGRGGYHLLSLNLVQVEHFLQALLVYVVLILWSVTLSKLAVLWFYGQIFQTRRFKIQLWFLGAVIVIFMIVMTFCLIFQTRPFQAQFKPWIEHKGSDPKTLYQVICGIDMVIDFAMLLLPLPQVWKLQMPLRKKILIGFFLLLGLMTCIITIFRFVAINQIYIYDATYTTAVAGIWTTVEIHLSIICSCAPMFPKLFNHWRDRSRRQVSDYDSETKESGGSRSVTDSEQTRVDTPNRSRPESEELKYSVHVRTDIEIEHVDRSSDEDHDHDLAVQYGWVQR